jgi:hypothetical protein
MILDLFLRVDLVCRANMAWITLTSSRLVDPRASEGLARGSFSEARGNRSGQRHPTWHRSSPPAMAGAIVPTSADESAISCYDDKGKKRWVVEPGVIEVQVGSSSRDIKRRAKFEFMEGQP